MPVSESNIAFGRITVSVRVPLSVRFAVSAIARVPFVAAQSLSSVVPIAPLALLFAALNLASVVPIVPLSLSFVVPIVPLALLSAALTRAFVVLTVPLSLPFVDPTAFANFESWSATLHATHWLYVAF